MASNQPNPAAPSKRGTFESLGDNPNLVQICFIVLTVVLVCIPVLQIIVYKGWVSAPQFAVAVDSLLPVELIIIFLINRIGVDKSTLSGADRVRVLVLMITAFIGANAALLGLGLPFTDRLKPIFAAGIEGWRQNKGALLLCGGLLFGGLLVMFFGVQLARSFERTRSDLRRVLYGFNAFLSCVLLLACLGLVNVLAYSGVGPLKWFDKPIDWTSSKIYTLKDTSRTLLENLKEPVKVYILIPEEILRREVTTLLDNCRNVTDQISWQSVSRDRDSAALIELQKKYLFREAEGLLVVYGSGDKEVSEFIKYNELFAAGGPSSFQFKGEGVLMKTIDYLASGKAKARIYFTQGQGELNVRPQGPAEMGSAGDDSIGEMWKLLGRGNYEPRELRFSPDVTRVPDDADVVVIARPSKKFSEQSLQILSDYMDKKKGKLFILFDVVTIGDKWVETGLEKLVRDYNVKVNEDRVLDADESNPANLRCFTNPQSPTPIGIAYWGRSGPLNAFKLRDARSVEPSTGQQGPAARFNVQPLLFAISEGVWIEKNLAANPQKIQVLIRSNPAEREKLTTQEPVSVAVTVTEPRTAPMRGNPHNFGGDQAPRLVVFGDATWASDTEINSRLGSQNFSLFGACLSWLRERPNITSDDRLERPVYQLNVKAADFMRLLFQPLGLMVLGVFGLGGAVWVARRR